MAVVIGNLGLAAGGAVAQPTTSPPENREPKAVGPAALVLTAKPEEPPSPGQTMRAYQALRPWVTAWAVPEEADAAAVTGVDGQPLAPVYGACVNLRLHGQLIGRGVAMAAGGTGGGAAEPDARLVVRAVARAIADADARLPVPNDLNRAEAIKLLTPDIQISLELAGAPKPITEDTWALIDGFLAPGLDGLVGRVGEGEPAIAFPSAMMMANMLPQKAIRGLISKSIGEGGAAAAVLSPKEIREKHAVEMWRFRVSHLAQCAPGKQPEFLYRGGRLVASPHVSRDQLEVMAWRLAEHLRTQFGAAAEHAERAQADKLPEAVGHDARELGDNAMLAAVAMNAYGDLRCARVSRTDREKFLYQTRSVIDFAGGPTGPMQQSLRLIARIPSGKANAIGVAQSQMLVEAALAEAATGVPAEVRGGPADWKEEIAAIRFSALSSVQRSLVLYSYAAYCRGSQHSRQQESLSSEVRRLFAETGEDRLVSLMPWLGWAEIDTADVGAIGTGNAAEIPSAVALRHMRSEVWAHQLTANDAGDDGADMIGGIVFTSGNTSPLPTWQCVRPLAFLATMLGDERLTEPGERSLELARLLQAFRFLRQLQVDESCGWMCPNPEAAIGGIRAATWDQTMPPDATSLTLLATCELLKSMDRLAAAGLPEKAPEDSSAKSPADRGPQAR